MHSFELQSYGASNPGLGAKIATAMINGNNATIVAFCDPATKKLHASEVEVLVSGFSYADLLKIARAMSVVGK